jgi:hypothetical protein
VIITLLIAGRLLALRKRHVDIFGESKVADIITIAQSLWRLLKGADSRDRDAYTSVIAIFIECYALQIIWQIANLISLCVGLKGNPVYLLFGRTTDQVNDEL